MSFDWLQYLDLASELSDQAKTSRHKEAKLRSSISRAYYATFHKSRQHSENNWGITIYHEEAYFFDTFPVKNAPSNVYNT